MRKILLLFIALLIITKIQAQTCEANSPQQHRFIYKLEGNEEVKFVTAKKTIDI